MRGFIPGTPPGKAFGTVTGCEKPDDWSCRAAAFCASSTSSAVLNADVGVGIGVSPLLRWSGDWASASTVGADESLGGALGTLR
jgi:hypothetical protein